MKVANGYIFTKRGRKKLPRKVWQKIRWQHALRLAAKEQAENNNKK